MIKTIINCVFCLALAVAVFLSPFGLTAARQRITEDEVRQLQVQTAQDNLNTARTALVNAVEEYNDTRDFDIYYGDVARISQIFSGLAGVSIQETMVVDPLNNFSDVRIWAEKDDNSDCNAVRFSLVVENVRATLSAIERMQLPIYSVEVVYPNRVNATILTGGEIQ